jgi:hypothetical protein
MELPSGNILNRWRRDVLADAGNESNHTVESNSIESTAYIQKKLMVQRVLAMAGVDGALDESCYKEALDALDKIISLRKNHKFGEQAVSSGDGSIKPTSCPNRPVKKGCPCGTSLKSYEANFKKQKTTKKGKRKDTSSTSEDEENPTCGKTKALCEIK